VYEIQDKPTIKSLINDGVLDERDLNKTVLDLIASFWYKNNKTIAENISRDVLGGLYDVCLNLTVDGQTMYSSCNNKANDTAVSTRIESGYEPGKPAYGYVARAFLASIRGKKDSSYVYFGGYVGDGNITTNITLPPFDNILEAYMEMDAGSNFTLYINGNYSGNYNNGTAGGGLMRADKFEVCNTTYNYYYCNNLTSGGNVLTFNFTGNRSFIGGGYFRVSFNTTQMSSEEQAGIGRYWFPGIYGFLNLYDSFYVPGSLENISIHLHYKNNYTTYLTIGNNTVHEDTSTNEQIVDLTDAQISSKFGSKVNLINAVSNKTIPIRLGTNSTLLMKQPNADVILITDLSGSMNWRMDENEIDGNTVIDCNNPAINNPHTKRISLAKCLDKNFTDIIMSASGNRMGLVGFNDNANVYTPNLDSTRDQLIAHINSNYPNSPSGGTCICCAINRAYQILNESSDSSRQKFIIVMSDGVTGYCCGIKSGSCNPKGNSTSGQYSDCGGGGADCTGNDCLGAMQNANYSSCRVHNDLNATVHSIGFGPVINCPNGNWTLRAIAACGNGSYNASTDAEGLKQIYRDIAQKILEIGFKAQIIEVTGNVIKNNTLYPDSYIEFNYTPTAPKYEYGEISLTRETARLKELTGDNLITDAATVTKEGWFNISDKVKIVDAKITSYSSEYWTDRFYLKSSKTGGWSNVYWLGSYGTNYQKWGDPFIVQIPVNNISTGNNSVRIGTGMSSTSGIGGSPDDRVIYTIRVKGSVGYDKTFPSSDLAVADANQRLMDLVSDYVNVTTDNVQNQTKSITGVQSIWGPSSLKVVTWENKTT
jgi:hypothetical protein